MEIGIQMQVETIRRFSGEFGIEDAEIDGICHTNRNGDTHGVKCVNSIALMQRLMALDSARRAREGVK